MSYIICKYCEKLINTQKESHYKIPYLFNHIILCFGCFWGYCYLKCKGINSKFDHYGFPK